MPKRDRYLWVCTNKRADGHPKGSCAERGAVDLQLELKGAVGAAGLASSVRVMTGSCQDLCWVGVTAAVMPDNVFLKHLTKSDLPAVIAALGRTVSVGDDEALRAAGKIVLAGDYDDPGAGLVKLGKKPAGEREGGGAT